MLLNNPELKSKIDQLWNKFWSGGISNPLDEKNKAAVSRYIREAVEDAMIMTPPLEK